MQWAGQSLPPAQPELWDWDALMLGSARCDGTPILVTVCLGHARPPDLGHCVSGPRLARGAPISVTVCLGRTRHDGAPTSVTVCLGRARYTGALSLVGTWLIKTHSELL